MSETLKLIQALGSKICHDLAGSIGIIDSCLGLLEGDNKTVGEQAKSLLLEESKNLVKRIKFFRSTYGLAETGLEFDIVDMVNRIKHFFEGSVIRFNAHIGGDLAFVDAQMSKVGYCLVTIAAENIASVGVIDLYVDGKNGALFRIIANGKDFPLKPECFSVLNGDIAAPLSVTNCREHYASNICNEYGYKLSVNKNGGSTEYFVIKS